MSGSKQIHNLVKTLVHPSDMVYYQHWHLQIHIVRVKTEDPTPSQSPCLSSPFARIRDTARHMDPINPCFGGCFSCCAKWGKEVAGKGANQGASKACCELAPAPKVDEGDIMSVSLSNQLWFAFSHCLFFLLMFSNGRNIQRQCFIGAWAEALAVFFESVRPYDISFTCLSQWYPLHYTPPNLEPEWL